MGSQYPWATFKGKASGKVLERTEALEFGDDGLPVYSLVVLTFNGRGTGYRVRVPDVSHGIYQRVELLDEVEISLVDNTWDLVFLLGERIKEVPK